MERGRKRRREICSRCGQSFSNPYINKHRVECNDSSKLAEENSRLPKATTQVKDVDIHVPLSSEDSCVEMSDMICETLVPELNKVNKTLRPTSNEGLNHEIDDTELPECLSVSEESDFRSRLQQRFDDEDFKFFENFVSSDVTDIDQEADNNVTEPSVEIWEDEGESERQDEFTSSDSDIGSSTAGQNHTADNTTANNRKIDVLVKWLMLFLAFWQSKYSIADSAISILIKFLSKFFLLLGAFNNTVATIAKLFPSSLYNLRKLLGTNVSDFHKFVVCPKCNTLYKFEDCVEVRCGEKVSAKCTFVPWPNHPHKSKRGACSEYLLKKIRHGKNTTLYPRMVFPYNSLTKHLQTLLKRPGFWNSCQSWREKETPDNIMADIHHGKVWKELSTTGFLSNSNSIALALNVDWFQPYKHSPGSIGVLYMVVLNLPREERYKVENVIIVGILPGPAEPKLTANTYLKPLVVELQKLWKMRELFSVNGSFFPRAIKVGLICVTCDIPASRKIGGFMGHMADQGCSRCKKHFCRDNGLDFSGFNRDEWQNRNSDEHKRLAKETLMETSPASQQARCSKHGARYSVLHDLEYFDCIRFFPIDPMHNLYLGTAKHVMKNVWQKEGSPMFNDEAFKKMQAKVDSMITPQDIGRIPGKISSNFSGFTADQWQLWTVVYSSYALQDVLEDKHLKCWQLFATACKNLGKKVITYQDIELGDLYMMQFLKKFVELYGTDFVTPNMHLHGHLKECLLDFGPFHGFWCFSFERYNGILGSYHTNNRAIEIQIMRKFLAEVEGKVFDLPTDYKEELQEYFCQKVTKGSLKKTCDPVDQMFVLKRHQNIPLEMLSSVKWTDVSNIQPLPPMKDFTLTTDDLIYLRIVYKKLIDYDENLSYLDIPFTVTQYSSILIASTLYGSKCSRTPRNSFVLAKWAGNYGRIEDNNSRPGEILHFFRHRIQKKSLEQSTVEAVYTFHIARINWYSPHPDKCALGGPLQIWVNDFDCFGAACFMPVQRLKSRLIVTTGKFRRENVLVVAEAPGEN